MNEEKKQRLLNQYGEIGVCTHCRDYMVWQKQDYSFVFQGKTLIIENMDLLVCTNPNCRATGKNTMEFEQLVQRAKRRFYLTNITKSSASFLKNYED